jgi:polyhydroxyalkanoate synthesis regulator phasin
MPQPKRRSPRGAAAKQSTTRSGTRKAAARKAPPSRARSAGKPRAAASRRQAAATDDLRAHVQAALEALNQGIVLTRERLQEVMDDAVSRGRMTRADANTLVLDLVRRGRRQTEELRRQAEALRADVEQLVGRAGGGLERRAGGARRRAVRATAGDRALREVDRARRAAGLGRFPILNYEDLTAGQIAGRLGDLSPAELRKVRDHERRNANRKSVLSAIEKALG